MLGEYGTASGVAASEVMDQLCSIVESQNVSDTVRGVMLTAFGKLASHFQQKLTPAAEEIQHSASLSANPDLQQRALELQALLRFASRLQTIPKAQLSHGCGSLCKLHAHSSSLHLLEFIMNTPAIFLDKTKTCMRQETSMVLQPY